MKPIHKFNNGRGAMLCNICRTIISTGTATKELYCNNCKQETLEEAAERLYPIYDRFKYDEDWVEDVTKRREDFIEGAKWQQEQIGKSEFLQKLRATLSDAEARRLIRTI
jgi:hypothetical protein